MESIVSDNWLFSLCQHGMDDARAILLARGEETSGNAYICLVQEGEIQVLSRSAGGEEILINTLGEGNVFGLSDLFLDVPSDSTVLRARTKSKLSLLEKDLVRDRLRSDPASMEKYARFCNEKLQFLLARIEALTPKTAHERLIDHILTNRDEDGRFVLTSKETLAKHLGIGRSSLFRELDKLQKEGIILPEGKKKYRTDVQRLKKAAPSSDKE